MLIKGRLYSEYNEDRNEGSTSASWDYKVNIEANIRLDQVVEFMKFIEAVEALGYTFIEL